MKTWLKVKNDRNITSNKKVFINGWGKILSEILEGVENQFIIKKPGKTSLLF